MDFITCCTNRKTEEHFKGTTFFYALNKTYRYYYTFFAKHSALVVFQKWCVIFNEWLLRYNFDGILNSLVDLMHLMMYEKLCAILKRNE